MTPWAATCRTPRSFTISQSLLKLMSVESSLMLSNNLILCYPILFLPQSFLASRSLPMSWLFASGGQSIGTSASAPVLPMNIQGWFPLGMTGLISCCPRDSQVFYSTTIQSINSLALSLVYDLTFTSVHNYWKSHSFDYADHCWQSDVSAF